MANEEVKNLIDNAPETTETPAQETDFEALLQGVDLNKLLEYEGVKKLVQAQSDKRVTQALATAKAKWQQEQKDAQTEAEKLAKMTEEQQEKYKFDQERAAFEAEKTAFARSQLIVETQKQMLNAGLPDLAEYITGKDADETSENLKKIADILGTWKASQLNQALRGTVPKDTNPGDQGTKIPASSLKGKTAAEINALYDAGRIDLTK